MVSRSNHRRYTLSMLSDIRGARSCSNPQSSFECGLADVPSRAASWNCISQCVFRSASRVNGSIINCSSSSKLGGIPTLGDIKTREYEPCILFHRVAVPAQCATRAGVTSWLNCALYKLCCWYKYCVLPQDRQCKGRRAH